MVEVEGKRTLVFVFSFLFLFLFLSRSLSTRSSLFPSPLKKTPYFAYLDAKRLPGSRRAGGDRAVVKKGGRERGEFFFWGGRRSNETLDAARALTSLNRSLSLVSSLSLVPLVLEARSISNSPARRAARSTRRDGRAGGGREGLHLSRGAGAFLTRGEASVEN